MEKKRGKGRPPKPKEELTYCVTYSAPRWLVEWLDSFLNRHKEYLSRSALITAAIVFFRETKEKAEAK